MAGSRMTMRADFGLVTLDLHYVLAEDIGEFRCVVSNQFGQDETVGMMDVKSRAAILADVQHPASWQRIQEIEAPRPLPGPAEPTVYAKPQFTHPLQVPCNYGMNEEIAEHRGCPGRRARGVGSARDPGERPASADPLVLQRHAIASEQLVHGDQ